MKENLIQDSSFPHKLQNILNAILRWRTWGDPWVTIWDVIPMTIYHTTRCQTQKTEIFAITHAFTVECYHSVTELRTVGVMRGLMRRERDREGAGGQIPTKVGPPAIQT
jgi:hypothetical protein